MGKAVTEAYSVSRLLGVDFLGGSEDMEHVLGLSMRFESLSKKIIRYLWDLMQENLEDEYSAEEFDLT